MHPETRIRLARAHAVLAVLTLLLAAVAMLLPSGAGRWPKLELQVPMFALRFAAIGYLLLSAVSEWRRAGTLARLDRAASRPALLALLGHLWVLFVAGAAAWRGVQSRTLLAGGDPVLAALMTASGLALALMMTEWWLRAGDRTHQGEAREAADSDPVSWLTAVTGWLVVLALWYIETMPLVSR